MSEPSRPHGSLLHRLGHTDAGPGAYGLRPSPVARARGWLLRLLGRHPGDDAETLPPLPAALRRGELARAYLAADRVSDHRRAGVAASVASERAAEAGQWWPADVWAHRALWHYEQAEMPLHATRAARHIGDVRLAAGDPSGARRYYAEAISEARDLGAEREEGLAALGMGRAELDLGNVSAGRRLAQIAVGVLERCAAPESEVAAARQLRGEERAVGGDGQDTSSLTAER